MVLREVRCEWLYLDNITLGQSATMALMDAMDSRVEELTLGNVDMADLLGRYDGRQVSEGGVSRSHHEEKPP